jgi:gamma-glutamylaminecyclotransferase
VTHRLFVYGSLKRGFAHHDQLRGASLEGEMRTEAGYRLVRQGRYPALVEGGTTCVSGEVYRVSPELLERLDAFEGCPELYQRRRVTLADGSEAEAYLIGSELGASFAEVEGGSWKN